MRTDREKAFELRKEGKSYAAIRKQLGVPLSTLSGWFRGVEWSKGLAEQLRKEAQKGSVVRIEKLNQVRGDRLRKTYERAVAEARDEFRALRHDPLFVAGMTLFLVRGAKGVPGQMRFTSADPELVKLFLAFLTKTCGVGADKVRPGVFAHPGLDGQTATRFWALALGMQPSRFVKTMTVPGKHDAREFRYGSCTLTVSSSYLKVKMVEWAALLPKELIDRP